MAGTGKHEVEDEQGQSRIKREDLANVGRKLESTEIESLLLEVRPATTAGGDEKTNVIGKRINSAMLMVRRLLQEDAVAKVDVAPGQRAAEFQRPFSLSCAANKSESKGRP